jgi:hypothetical protein
LAPTGTDFAVYFADTNENLGGNNPTSSPAITLLQYDHVGAGSAATFFTNAPTQLQSFNQNPATNRHWGTIAVEIKRP